MKVVLWFLYMVLKMLGTQTQISVLYFNWLLYLFLHTFVTLHTLVFNNFFCYLILCWYITLACMISLSPNSAWYAHSFHGLLCHFQQCILFTSGYAFWCCGSHFLSHFTVFRRGNPLAFSEVALILNKWYKKKKRRKRFVSILDSQMIIEILAEEMAQQSDRPLYFMSKKLLDC